MTANQPKTDSTFIQECVNKIQNELPKGDILLVKRVQYPNYPNAINTHGYVVSDGKLYYVHNEAPDFVSSISDFAQVAKLTDMRLELDPYIQVGH